MNTLSQCVTSQCSAVCVEPAHKVEEVLDSNEQALEHRTCDYVERSGYSRNPLRSLAKLPSDCSRALPVWRGKKFTFRILAVMRCALRISTVSSKLADVLCIDGGNFGRSRQRQSHTIAPISSGAFRETLLAKERSKLSCGHNP